MRLPFLKTQETDARALLALGRHDAADNVMREYLTTIERSPANSARLWTGVRVLADASMAQSRLEKCEAQLHAPEMQLGACVGASPEQWQARNA